MRALFTTRSQGTLANAAWENQKRPSARSVSPARVVQIERTTTSPEISPNSLEPFRPSRPSWPSPCTSGNNHSNSKDRKRTSHALALGGAGSAMLFSVAAAI
jgi:DNA-binding transcriptional regulator YdaS (Cro superfamily)